MTTLNVLTYKPESQFYEHLLGKVDEQLLHLQDARGTFFLDNINESNLKYFMNQIVDKPWNNHLLLTMLVYASFNSDVKSIHDTTGNINVRLNNIFEAFYLKEMTDLEVETHMYAYFKGSVYPEHSDYLRSKFLSAYRRVAYFTKKWVTTKLINEQQAHFEQFLFLMPSYGSRDFSFTKSAIEHTQNTRKNETDAIVPLLPQIRAEGHLRWNQVNRLRQAFYKAVEQVKTTESKLPLVFHYDEPTRVGERFYFQLWDKPSFVLNHKDQFSALIIKEAHNRTGTYSDKNNCYFVEYIKAERLDEEEEAEGLWFIELFEKDVLAKWHQDASEEEIQQKRKLLHSWGYGDDNLSGNSRPFHASHKGLLTISNFVSKVRKKVKGVLFEVEPIFAAVTFSLLALDIFTTTGARLNELLQISNTRECIRTVRVGNKLRYSFYAVPKGRDEEEAFYISEQTMKLLQMVGKLLKEHYGTPKIPSVEYRHTRKHLFPNPKPYFFQYHNKAFGKCTIGAILRFLLHGLHFESQEGKPVTVKSHLLRHAFATEAVQRQKLPTDIVAKILHQRDIAITDYYSEPTASQVSQSVSDLHDVISDYVDLDEAVLRGPEELEKELEEYKEKVGVFNNVIGGTCVTDHVCPIKMQCLGCQAKIPQPEKKHELLEVIELSKDMEKRYSSMGLTVEVKKAKVMGKQARNELKEIELIEKYREEQGYEPHIQFKK